MKSGPLCALLWRILTWCSRKNSQNLTHSRPAECQSRQAIQAKPDHPDKMDSPSRGLLGNMLQVAPASRGPVCHQVQQLPQFVSAVPDSLAWAVDTLHWVDLRPYFFQLVDVLGKLSCRTTCARVCSNCSRVAQHALVLGPSGHVKPDPFVSAQSAHYVDSTIQSDPSQASVNLYLHVWLLDRKLQPSTFEGCRSASAGNLGNSPIIVSIDENLT